ncbi:helix-turn-helix domain-containing protein [Formosa sp. S-31]|uniref:helix-turn-helix domain-containing protein n=1 Tax=Formosa sp. S-31 TaxID=2790949 RepID=UPI003EB9935A
MEQQKIPTLNVAEVSSYHDSISHSINEISNVKCNDYHVNSLSVIKDKMKFKVRPHRKTVHDFLFLTRGKAKRSKGLNHIEFEGPAVFFLPAYQITQHSHMSEDAEGYFCHFDEDLFEYLPNGYLVDRYPFFKMESDPVILLSEETKEGCVSILNRLLALYASGEKTRKILVASYLMAFFEELKKELISESKKSFNSSFRITEEYKQALSENIYNYNQISDYASLLNITPNYLNKCVKDCVNKTAQDLLKEMIVLEAKSLIKYSDLHVSEIAVKLCNQSPSNFSRFFKNQTGMTPKQYAQLD